jgi:hypothetical protein
MGVPAACCTQRAQDNPVFFNALSASSQGRFIPQAGAVVDPGPTATVLGAVGASGGTGARTRRSARRRRRGRTGAGMSGASRPAWTRPGCACGIDVHAHVIPHDLPRYLGQCGAGRLAVDGAGACLPPPCDDGRPKVYRTVSERAWSRQAPSRTWRRWAWRTGHFADAGAAVLLDGAAAAAQLLRYMNDQIAEMAAHSGGRLVGMGAVPLQDLDLALAELDYG